ncbi:MAG: 2-oxoglutarate oxidoreductase [Candidatus Omnitrophica bacterium]|nr:2-oxoglutarate oxidoreductase [Candidatus Omnitrophota bacterium]
MGDQENSTAFTVKDLNTENPRWCVGCGNFGILMGLKRFMVDKQIQPHKTVNISGIGCSGRAPNYINTYGIHSIHGRPITLATGIALTRPDLNIFIHSGDGDAMSIGGNHLLHGINKNFNCVFLMYDNELYSLTKCQTSPTTRKGHKTNTQPQGTFLEPLNPVRFAIGAGASFVANTADWMQDHLTKTIELAYEHKGFSFVHISQRCTHFDPENFDPKNSSNFSFLTHENGLPVPKHFAEGATTINHDPTDSSGAFRYANSNKIYFGLFYRDRNKPRYDEIVQKMVEETPRKPRNLIFDAYKV